MSDQSDAQVEHGEREAAWRSLAAADSLLAGAEQAAPRWVEPTVRRGWIADQRSRWAGSTEQVEAGRWIIEGMRHAQVALRLDSLSADALELRGTLQYWKWLLDLEPDAQAAKQLLGSAETDLRRAIELRPVQAGAWAALSHLLLNRGATGEAKMAAARAYDADAYLRSADLIIWRLFSTSYDLEDRIEAQRWCSELGRRFPSDQRFAECQLWLMSMHGAKVDIPRAWELAEQYERGSSKEKLELDRRWAAMAVAAALASAGRTDSARAVALRSRGTAAIDPARDLVYVEAFVRSLLGDKQEAIDLLTEYVAVSGRDLSGPQHWWFAALRDEPRYQALRTSN